MSEPRIWLWKKKRILEHCSLMLKNVYLPLDAEEPK